MVRKLHLILVLAGVVYYRSKPILTNAILSKTPLPVGYVSNGNYASDCEPLGPGNAPGQFDQLAYCEDTAFWELYDDVESTHASSRFLLAGCDPNRKSWNTVMGPLSDPAPRGSLWVYQQSKQDGAGETGAPSPGKPERVELKNYPEGHDFHPLGFEIWPSYSGNASNLYVINHARERTVIEHFVMSPSSPTAANHVRTISSGYFISPNSVALTSPDSFYVSNDHLVTRRWPFIGHFIPLIESLLAVPLAFISHVTLNPASPSSSSNANATSAIASHTFAATFLPFPNGMALSADGSRLAFASSSLADVYFYARDPVTNTLTKIRDQTVNVPFCPDNVRFAHPLDNKGGPEELIVAGHPHFPSLIQVAKNATGAASGSWVVSIQPKSAHQIGHEVGRRAFDSRAPISVTLKHALDSVSRMGKILLESVREQQFERVFESQAGPISTRLQYVSDGASRVFEIVFRDKAEQQLERQVFDTQAPISTSKYVSDGASWTLKTLFQSNGEQGGWPTSSTGIRDPDSGTLYVAGLYSDQGILACKPGDV